jgi:phosphoribosylanthranilate isomerase
LSDTIKISKTQHHPQIKICGLTDVYQALECARLGVNAIGCVFYPKSPRHLTEEKARAISSVLPENVKSVGVLVNRSFSKIMELVERCRLNAVQLHGQESPALVNRLRKEDILIIKTLFINGEPSLKAAQNYDATAFLVEHSGGRLPGGNAMDWNWGIVKDFGKTHPLVLAGGLTPDNVSDAITACLPEVVDVSSGVESIPGQKDIKKVRNFVAAVANTKINRMYRKIY